MASTMYCWIRPDCRPFSQPAHPAGAIRGCIAGAVDHRQVDPEAQALTQPPADMGNAVQNAIDQLAIDPQVG